MEKEHLKETMKSTVETQQDDFADIFSGTVTVPIEPSAINGKNFEDSSCDLSQVMLAVETVARQTVAVTAGEDTAPVQTSNHKLDGNSSSVETVITTSKTKAVSDTAKCEKQRGGNRSHP